MTLLLLDIPTDFLHLMEAEGKILKRGVMNSGWTLAFIGASSLLILAAAGFFLAGIYQYLVERMSIATASLLVALAALVLAFIFAAIAKWQTVTPK